MIALAHARMALWMAWVVASLFYAYQFILRVMPSILLQEIMQQFEIDAAAFGQFSGIYYIGYSLMHLPIGILLDRYGPRKVMACCILLTVVGLMPLLLCEHWAYLILGRFLVGVGSSAAILGLFKIIRMAFAEKRFARMLSISVAIGLLGAIYGGGPVYYLCELFGYQAVVALFSVAGVALALIAYAMIPASTGASQSALMADVKEVLCNPRVVIFCLLAGCMVIPLEGFADGWAAAFLQGVWGFDGAVAAQLPSMIFIGMCVGSPLLSWIADKVGSYLLTIIGAGFVMAIGFLLLLTCPLTAQELRINFLLIGVCCAYQILAIYQVSTYVRPELAGLTTAVANMIIMTFGYFSHSMMGAVVQLMGGPEQPEALLYGVAVAPIGLLLGTLGFFIILKRKKHLPVPA